MTSAAWNITWTRMFVVRSCERFSWSPSHACAWIFRCPLGLPLPWCVLFHVHGHPGPSQCRGTPINFIHTPGYTAFKEAYEQLSSKHCGHGPLTWWTGNSCPVLPDDDNALMIVAFPQCLSGEPSCQVDSRAWVLGFFCEGFCPLLFFWT